jgi:hypothetical protein
MLGLCIMARGRCLFSHIGLLVELTVEFLWNIVKGGYLLWHLCWIQNPAVLSGRERLSSVYAAELFA